MEKNEVHRHRGFILGGILLIAAGMLLPILTQSIWFDIIYKIRRAIHVGDSGHLILSAASLSFMYAIQSTAFFLGAILVLYYTKLRIMFSRFILSLLFFLGIILLHILNSRLFHLPWEPVSTVLALVIALYIFQKLFGETNSILHVSIVSIQVFFAFQWLNIMPLFSPYHIGQSDIPYSIKTAGLYLETASVLNFTGFAFFMPFIASAFITAAMFINYSRNIFAMKDNYEKEREIQNMKSKILENRIYKEVKSLVHDLKTPLVTIRGLSSLLAVSKDPEKLEEYSGRIESSVDKMNEMISSFLFETSRQKLQPMELISYIRAQLPLEDESIKIEIILGEQLPEIHVNKITMARAIINILENAILVPHKHLYKHIIFEVKAVDNQLQIKVQDNGIGINQADIHRIWEVGYSTNNTSGLGLPFAKQIIEDNEGTIELISVPEEGTTVLVNIPTFDSLMNTDINNNTQEKPG